MLEYYKIDVSDNIGPNKTNVDVSVFFVITGTFSMKFLDFRKKCAMFSMTRQNYSRVLMILCLLL